MPLDVATAGELAKTRDWQKDLDQLLAKHALVLVGSTARVVNWKRRNQYPGDYCSVIEFLTIEGFKQFYSNLHYPESCGAGNTRQAPLTKKFFEQAERFGGVVFVPGADEVIDRQLNMWRGFGLDPKPGAWLLMQEHIKNVIAAGDAASARYIVNWLAWAVQNPGIRAEVALVLRGGKGTGKGALGNALVRIFGSHGTHISNRKHLISGFNMHLAHCAFLFADEAYWPGDRAGEGELKRLVTEPTLLIEPKGIDPFSVCNCLHVIIAGNEQWVVPASCDERRFAVFEVSDAERGDPAYFNALYLEQRNGGLEAMLHDLLAMDLHGWHPRLEVPQTQALRRQQIHTLHGVDALVVELAHEGQLPCPISIVNEHLDVTSTAGEEEGRGFWVYAKKTVPGLKYQHCRVIMSELREWGCAPYRNASQRGVRFPPLAELRRAVDAKLGPQEWDGQMDWA